MIRALPYLGLCLLCSSFVLGDDDVLLLFPQEKSDQAKPRFKRQVGNGPYYDDGAEREGATNRFNFNSAKGNSQAINSGKQGDANSVANVVSNQYNHPRRFFGGHNPFAGFGRGFGGFNANSAQGNSQAINHGHGDANSAANVVANQFGNSKFANRGAFDDDDVDEDDAQLVGGRNFNSAIGNSQAINNGYGDANSLANVGSNQNNFPGYGYPRRRPFLGGRRPGQGWGSRGRGSGVNLPPRRRYVAGGGVTGGGGGGGGAVISKGGGRGSWGAGGGGGGAAIGPGGIGAVGGGISGYGGERGWGGGGGLALIGKEGIAASGGGGGGRRVPSFGSGGGGGGATLAENGGLAAGGVGGGGDGYNKLQLDWPFGPVFNSNSAIGNSQAINHGIGHANSATNVVANSNRLLAVGEDDYGPDNAESYRNSLVNGDAGEDGEGITYVSGYPRPLDYQYYTE